MRTSAPTNRIAAAVTAASFALGIACASHKSRAATSVPDPIVLTQPVSLYLNVEKGGKLIEGLQPQNLRLYQDGEPVPFHLATPERPVTVAIVAEYSRSSYYYIDDISQALQSSMSALPDGNWYALVTFSNQSNINVDFTRNKAKIVDGYNSLGQPLWSEIDTYDALYDVLDKMSRMPGRRAIIFIGSGFNTFSKHTLKDVENKAAATDITIYALGAGSLLRGQLDPYLGMGPRMDLLQARAFMQMLADVTGGEAWFPQFEMAFADAMKGVGQLMETSYRLVYVPRVPADGKLHKIKVEAFRIVNDKREDYKVRVREGWRVG